jgi:hypothetical protein
MTTPGGTLERDHRLAEPATALEQDVLGAVDELEFEDPLDERTIDLFGVVPVEAVLGLAGAKAGEPCPASEVDCDPRPLLEISELLEGLGGAEVALVDMGEECGELRVVDAKPEPAKPLAEVVVTHRRTPGRAE